MAQSPLCGFNHSGGSRSQDRLEGECRVRPLQCELELSRCPARPATTACHEVAGRQQGVSPQAEMIQHYLPTYPPIQRGDPAQAWAGHPTAGTCTFVRRALRHGV